MKSKLTQHLIYTPIFVLLLFFSSVVLNAQISSTALGGNWGDAATWVGGTVPQAADNVTIPVGAAVDLNVAGACNNLTVQGTFRFSTATRAFTSTGTTTIGNAGTVNFSTTTTTASIRSFNDIVVNAGGTWNSTSFVTVTGNITNNGSFIATTAGTFTLSGTSKTISGAAITISSATATVSGTYTNSSTDLKFDGTLSGTGSLTNAANSSLILVGATTTITTLVASAAPNTVTYNRAGTQQVKGATYHNLIIAGNNTKTVQAAITVNNNLSISAGTVLYDNGIQINGISGATLTVDGELQLGAAVPTSLPSTFGTVNINAGSTIHFSSTSAAGQQILNTTPYQNLRVSGVSIKTVSGNTSIGGNLTISSGTLNVGEFNITVKGNVTNSGTQTGNGKVILNGGTVEHSLLGTGTYTNLELNDSQGASLGANIIIKGALTLTQGSFKTLSRSITLNGTIAGSGAGVIYIGPTDSGDIIIGGTTGGNLGTIYMAAAPNNAIRRFTLNRTGSNSSLTFANVVVIREQLNLLNGNIVHINNLTLGSTTTVLTTIISNGTISNPPIFNSTYTGAYRLQYGDVANLTANLVTGALGEIPLNRTVERIILNNNTQNTITLGADLTITGTITFTSGKLLLGDKNIFTSYTGAGAVGSASSYLVTNGSGQFYRTIAASTTGNYNFPIGTIDNYSNANITFVDNSNMSVGKIGARVVGETPVIAQTVNYLKKYWAFTDDRSGSGFTYKPTFTFNPSEVTGSASALKIGRFTPTRWDVYSPVALTANTIALQTGSIGLPLTGNGVVFSALSDPIGVTPPASVWEVIVGSDVHTTLETAVLAAGLQTALEGPGPLTVFAPTDAAFALLPAGVLTSLLADPQGALTNLLKYHVVGGVAALSSSLTNGQVIPTLLAGKDVVVSIIGNNVLINDALVTIADIVADNGVVHVINAVLNPESGVGVNDLSSTSLAIYPNPAKNYFMIDCSRFEGSSYELHSMEGRIISAGIISQQQTQINCAELSTGIYFVKVNNGATSIFKKVVID
jgi:hypothetical protein